MNNKRARMARAALCRQTAAIAERTRFWRLLEETFSARANSSAADLKRFCSVMRGSLNGAHPFDGNSAFKASTRLRWLREWRKLIEPRFLPGVK